MESHGKFVLLTEGEYSDYGIVDLFEIPADVNDDEFDAAHMQDAAAFRADMDRAYQEARVLYADRGGEGEYARSRGWNSELWMSCLRERQAAYPTFAARLIARFGGRQVSYRESHIDR